jgi:predicted branched-subunit amino acid permease
VAPAPSSKDPSRSAELWAGVVALAPLLVGVAPFGVIYGLSALKSGIPAGAAMAMSSVLFAGSAQFLVAQLAGAGTPGLVMVASVALVNLRHALYSASVAPALSPLPRRWKLALAYLLTDEAYAAAIGRLSRPGAHRHWFLLGSGLALWSGWQASTAAGILLGAALAGLPEGVQRVAAVLDFALPLTFIAMVVPMIRSRAAVLAAAVAALVAVVGAGWPFQLGLIGAALAGIVAGWLAAGRREPA